MSNPWTQIADIRAQLLRLWQRGKILTALVEEDQAAAMFPLRLTMKSPRSGEMVDRFNDVRHWILTLKKIQHLRVEMRHFRHPSLGENDIPAAIWVDDIDHALALIGKTQEAQCFLTMVAQTRQRQPLLFAWLLKRPVFALTQYAQWTKLLDVIDWFVDHPRSGVYIRQIDVAGVHSKFIEAHRKILIELLDAVLPDAAIETSAAGVAQFCRRYGLLDKPIRIRFRMLDTRQNLLAGNLPQDITLDHQSFAQLDLPVRQVFITENEINFLAFPPLADSVVIFGAGYGFEALSEAHWLHQRHVYYWGDIDTHGFAILDQLRSHFPHVRSLLMDEQTLMDHQCFWGLEHQPTVRQLTHLHEQEQEQTLYDALQNQRIQPGLRLEQEHIAFDYLLQALSRLAE